MPKKKKKDRPLFKGRSHKSFLNQCRLKLVTLPPLVGFFVSNLFLTRLTSDPRKVINSSYSKTKKKLKTTEDCL